MATRTHTVIDSPTGPLTLVAEGHELVGLHFVVDGRSEDPRHLGERNDAAFSEVVTQLDEYFEGRRRSFDVPVKMIGTDFQREVWAALTTIPYGETWSYGELAAAIGRPTASRAVGAANGRNPVAIIVPCHRVIGAAGTLTGFGGGLDNKRLLLGLEGIRTADEPVRDATLPLF